MNPEKKEAIQKALDDTMTVSQAKQRKLDLRAKEILEFTSKTLDRKNRNDAAAEKRRQEREKASADAKKAAAQEKKDSAGTSAIIAAKKKRDALEKKKLERVKGIAAKKKEGVKKSMDRAREVGSKGGGTIKKDDGDVHLHS